MKRLIPLALAALLCVASSCPAAGPGSLQEVARRLAAKAATVETIRAGFTQTKHLSIFSEAISSRGGFAFQRPDRLRWELFEPVRTGFAVSGAKGVRWHELEGQAKPLDLKLDPVLGALARQLICWATVDLEKLGKDYLVELTGEAPAAFKLTPKSEELSRHLTAIEVVFAADERRVRSVTLREAGGDYTEMLFDEGAMLNEPLPAGIFDSDVYQGD